MSSSYDGAFAKAIGLAIVVLRMQRRVVGEAVAALQLVGRFVKLAVGECNEDSVPTLRGLTGRQASAKTLDAIEERTGQRESR